MEGSTLGDGRHSKNDTHRCLLVRRLISPVVRPADDAGGTFVRPAEGMSTLVFWFRSNLNHFRRECNIFWALWIVGAAIIVKGWINVVSSTSRRRAVLAKE
jgi:hypothetical protein